MKENDNGTDPFLERGLPSEIEAERAVLGAVLLNPNILDQVVDLVEPSELFLRSHQYILQAMLAMASMGQPIDLITMSSELRKQERFERVGGATYIARLIDGVPRTDTIKPYAKLIKEAALKRRLITTCSAITADIFDGDKPFAEIVQKAEEAVFALAESRRGNEGPEHIATTSARLIDYFEQKSADPAKLIGLGTGYEDLDRRTLGLTPGLTLIAARPSHGKAQPLDAQVLTKTGWKRMGDLKLDEELASPDGRPSFVEGIFPQGQKQVFTVLFSDRRKTECCAEHLWRVYYRDWEYPRVFDTNELRIRLCRQRYRKRLWSESFTGEFGHDDELPVDPWLLGALLGDGGLSHGGTPQFSNIDSELISRVRNVVRDDDLALRYNGHTTYRIGHIFGRGHGVNPLTETLRELGLMGCHSYEKFIPAIYKNANRLSRLELLRGLLDTDGTVEKYRSIGYCTTSERLAIDVIDLVRSLGGWVTCREKQPTYVYKGEKKYGRIAYDLRISYPGLSQLFTLPRKLARLEGEFPKRDMRSTFESIYPSRITETQCIKVSHPSGLYVTDDYIVTHNTSLATNIACNVAHNGGSVYFASLESGAEKIAQRVLASESRIDSYRMRSSYMNREEWGRLADTLRALSITRFVIDDTPDITPEELGSRCRQYKSQNGLDLLVVDYLQLMARRLMYTRRYRDLRIAVQEVGSGLIGLSRMLDIPVLALAQLSREVDNRPGHRPQMSDLAESASLEMDSDLVIFLLREEKYKRTDQNQNIATVIFGKNRDGSTDEDISMAFIKNYTRFESLDKADWPISRDERRAAARHRQDYIKDDPED